MADAARHPAARCRRVSEVSGVNTIALSDGAHDVRMNNWFAGIVGDIAVFMKQLAAKTSTR